MSFPRRNVAAERNNVAGVLQQHCNSDRNNVATPLFFSVLIWICFGGVYINI